MNDSVEIGPAVIKMPPTIKIALIVLLGSFIRSTLTIIYEIKNRPNGTESIDTWVPLILMVGIVIVLFSGIYYRKNWSRFGLLILSLLALYVQITTMVRNYNIYKIK